MLFTPIPSFIKRQIAICIVHWGGFFLFFSNNKYCQISRRIIKFLDCFRWPPKKSGCTQTHIYSDPSIESNIILSDWF